MDRKTVKQIREDAAEAEERQGLQFGPEDTAEGYRRHRVSVGFRGPDHGSKETMREYDYYG